MNADARPPSARPAPPGGSLAALVDLVRILPVPATRPVFGRGDEAAGLTLLELGLRMDHVQRVTESLTLIDRTHMRRSLAMDLDLGVLTSRQRQALDVRSFGSPAPEAGLEGPVPGAQDRLWLPVAWRSRDHIGPVVIHDEDGAVVPRLTGEATWAAMSAGLTRLLKDQVAAAALALRPGERPAVLGLQSRWLLERAIVVLVERGLTAAWGRMAELAEAAPRDGDPFDGDPFDGDPFDGDGDGDGDEDRDGDEGPGAVRARALAYLRGLTAATAAEFTHLLDLAAREQLLVAMVPAATSRPHLRFDGAPIPVVAAPHRLRVRPRDLLPVNREYTVEYRTEVPRRVAGYHLTIEVPEEIRVRRFMLTTDADEIAIDHLTRDLTRIARWTTSRSDAGADGAGDPGPWAALEEGELQDAMARVASVSRLRFAELQAYREYVRRFRARFGWELPRAQRRRRTAQEVVEELAEGRCDLSLLAALAVHQERGALVPRLRALTPARRAAALTTLHDHLCAADFGHGVTIDNDPRDNGAHAHWRHHSLRFGPRAMEPVTASFHLALADEPPALVESVVRMLVGLLAVLGLLWWLLRGRPTDGLQSDALVAVLLLVPGILLSRLDIQPGHSILGELRLFPRRVAYLSVVLTSGVALVAASDARDFVPAIQGAAAALLVLLGICLVELLARGVRRRSKVPRSAVVPRWLVEAMGVRHPRRVHPPDARFVSAGARAARSPRLDHPAPRPADLVALAAAASAAGSTGVAFEVVHAPGVASTHAAEGGHSLDDDCPGAAELFGFTAFGSTFEVRTRQVRDPAAVQARDRPPGFLVRTARGRVGSRSVASGLVALQPGALQPGAPGPSQSEFLVVLGDHEDTCLQQAMMTTHVTAELTRLLAEVHGMPLFLHAPAAPRPRMRTATEQARPAVLPVIRLALSDAEPFTAARVAFAERAVTLARSYGLGLSLGEGRASPSANHWREIVPFDRVRYHRTRRERFGALGEGRPGEATMVTVVGPATARTPGDLHRLARGFEELGLGCLAVSAWSLQRTVFVNALLARRPAHARGRDEPRPPELAATGTDVVPLARVVRQCSLLPQPPDAAGPIGPMLPQRFAVVLATRTTVRVEPDGGDERVVPFWVVWDVPAPADVDVITFRLTRAFAGEGRGARVTFLRAGGRAGGTASDRLRGRAKLAVRVPRSWGTPEFGTLAQRVAVRARVAVGEDFPGRQGAVRLQVAWGERWLGSPP